MKNILFTPLLLISCIFLQQANAQTISTIAGTGVSGSTGDGGAATAALISAPIAIAVDTAGNVYFANDYSIRKVTPAGIITKIAGMSTTGYGGDGGPATTAQFNNITSMAIDAPGNIYLTDRFNNRVRKINTSGIVTTFIGNGSYSSTGDGGTPGAATCGWPCAIAIDTAGTIFLADEGGERIRKISGGIINTIAGSGCMGCGGFAGDGGVAIGATFNAPVGIAVDAIGKVYISDFYNRRIRVINTSGIMNTYVGNGSTGFAGDGSPATAAELNQNWGVAITPSGELLIADQLNYRIRKVDAAGIITTIAGTGVLGYTGDGGDATAARISTPPNIAVDKYGNIYIADVGNNVIRKISSCSPSPALISGPDSVCLSDSITLTADTAGGVWSSGTTSVATISATGAVHGVAVGTAVISYTVSNSCGTAVAIASITVNTLPFTGVISGPSSVCVDSSITLIDPAPGGVWSSTSTAVATVSPTGVVTGVTAGTSVISYTVTNNCGDASATLPVSVTTTCTAGITGEVKSNIAVEVTPNPNNGTFYLSGTTSATDDKIRIEIKDVSGKVVYSDITVAKDGVISQKIILNNKVANGVYLLTLHSRSGVDTHKIVVVR